MKVRWDYDIRRVRIALVTAAYIDAFMRLGSAFVLNTNLDAVRAEILGGGSGALSAVACVPCQTQHRSVFFATAPVEFVCVGVAYYDLCVILPAASDRNAVIYDRLEAFRSGSASREWPPFKQLEAAPARWYPHGRYSITIGNQQLCLTQPDLTAIRRVDPLADAELQCLSDAPDWSRAELRRAP
jgi:hypothetical protein